ncbi:MAG: ribonuclease D, partial [Mycobacterium sp.]|nr:ribonuclease D [Mycobacterium sp.]
PESVRRLCWEWQGGTEASAAAVDDFLRAAGARAWQRELVVPVLTPAMTPPSA